MATKQAAIEAPTQAPSLQWSDLWRKDSWSIPGKFGVQQAIDESGVKFYRAWATASDHLHRESDIYESCDQADIITPDSGFIRLGVRDRALTAAATARAHMTPNQASPEDMRRRADDLHALIQQDYASWELEQEAKRKQAIDDEKCLLAARQVLRGLQLLMERGTPTEQLLLKRFLPTK